MLASAKTMPVVICANFEKLGLIRLQADENDLRVKHVFVTTKGRGLLEEIRRGTGPDFAKALAATRREHRNGRAIYVWTSDLNPRYARFEPKGDQHHGNGQQHPHVF